MKNVLYILISFIIASYVTGCNNNDNDVTLPEEFYYISFDKNSINVIESDEGPITIDFIYSGSRLSNDLEIKYTISYPDNNAAQEGVDFVLPSQSGSFILPAGESRVEVTLIESLINNELSVGARKMTFELNQVNNLLLGSPDNREAKSVTVTIGEDDLFEFGYTSFEEVPTFDVLERYPRPAQSADPLPNVQDIDPTSQAPYVQYVSSGDELGFTASFLAAAVDAVENEVVGVYNTTVTAANPDVFETNFIDGNQGYITSDLDGFVTLITDEIVGLNANVTNAVLDVKVFFLTTSWETEDGIVIYFETEDGLGEPLLSIFDDDVEAAEGVWQELRVPIPQNKLKSGRLVITFRNGADSEMILLDYISIKGIL